MKWMLALAASLVAAGGALGAGIVEYKLSAPSPTLGRPIPYAVYKPFPAPAEGERWPVVYLLHGLTGADGDWFTWGDLGPILDRAIAEGRIKPMVVVAPGAGDSWYVDNPDPGGLGLVETAFTTDLIKAIDSSLPTAACREGRAIGGLSMGGWGALLMTFDHPELFRAGISLSGALHQPMVKDDPRLFSNLTSLYQGAFGQPFDMARFNKANPFNHMRQLRRAADKPNFWLFIGDKDYPDLIASNVLMHQKLLEAGMESHLRVDAGRHYWETWQRAIVPALEWVSPQLSSGCGAKS